MSFQKIDPKREMQEKMELYKNRVIYTLPVRSGYWANELAIQEQQEYLYDYKKERCQLLVQKTRKMFRNLLRPIPLAPESTYIRFHQNYQIRSHGMSETAPCGKETLRPLYLSGVITETEIDSSQHFVHGCGLTASPRRNSYVRSTFLLIPCDSPNSENQSVAVNYGEDVYFQIVESGGLPLYVQCENSTMDSFGRHLSLRLSQSPDIYCRFKILHWKPQLRYETTGTQVLYNTYVIIQHTASGHNLAAEFHNWLPTFFGPECAVSCHTYRDTHKMETTENLWKIVGFEKTELEMLPPAQ